MIILESYTDDLAALEAATALLKTEPDESEILLDVVLYGGVLTRLFTEARDEILDARDLKITHEPDDLHASVVELARSVLNVAYEAQEESRV